VYYKEFIIYLKAKPNVGLRSQKNPADAWRIQEGIILVILTRTCIYKKQKKNAWS